MNEKHLDNDRKAATANGHGHRSSSHERLGPGQPIFEVYRAIVRSYGIEDLGDPEASWRAVDEELRRCSAEAQKWLRELDHERSEDERAKADSLLRALYAEQERKLEAWELLRILTGRDLPMPHLQPPPDAEPYFHLRWRCIEARVASLGLENYLKARAVFLAEEEARWALEQRVKPWFDMLQAFILAQLKKQGVPNEVPYAEMRDALCEALKRLHDYFSRLGK